MEYRVLTADHRRAMWRQSVGALEERHYALVMDRTLAAAIRPRAGETLPAEVGQRLRDLDAQLAAVEQQHARAVAELGPEEIEAPVSPGEPPPPPDGAHPIAP